MHGAASGGLARLLGCDINELNSDRDPLFGGASPEPLAKYVPELLNTLKTESEKESQKIRIGLILMETAIALRRRMVRVNFSVPRD